MPNTEHGVRQEVLDDIERRLQRHHPGRHLPRRGLVTLVITPRRREAPQVQRLGELPAEPEQEKHKEC